MRNMLRVWLVFFILNFPGAVCFAQNQWLRQSPLPQPRNLSGVAWISQTHAFVVGQSKTVMETLDGGTTWRSLQLASGYPDQPFYEVHFRDASNGFIFGNSGTAGPDFWRTTDSGATWQQITSFPLGGSWTRMVFVSASIGFMGSNGALVRTTDGGVTWTVMANYLTCPVIYGMDFRDARTGIAGGNRVLSPDSGPGIFKTTDGGAIWVRKHPQSANDVLWLNNTTLIATSASILRSTDAGETWTSLSNDVTTGLDDMELLPDGTIVGVSGTGDGWRSTNGGATWTRTLNGIGDLPADWAVSFYDSQLGSIVGQGGLIYKTTDGGLTWAMLNNGIGGVEFADLEMFDDNAGLVVGDNGYFLRTANGGTRWDTGRLTVTGVVLFRNESLKAVSVVDRNFAVAAGYDGVVYKTFDRGLTWQSIGYPNLPGGLLISDVKFINRNLGYVTGNRPGVAQNLYRTTDGGATWELINLNLGHSLDFIDANSGWVMNVGGLGYRTTNGGATWQQMILPNQGFNPTISKIDFINENEGWAIGWYGYAAHTIDGGRTWQLQTIATQEEHILGLHVLSPTEAFAVGIHAAPSSETASLYHTNDAGATWNKYPLPNQYSVSGVFATASRRVWVSGFDGTVLHNPNFNAPAPALLLTFNPTRTIGGSAVQGTIRINSPAPAGGRTVTLSSGNPALVAVPASVVIPAGATEAAFNVTTQAVSPNQPSPRVTITAQSSGNTDTADLVLAPSTDCTFTLSPTEERFGATGGIVVVNVNTPSVCTWSAVSGSGWITFPNNVSGTGSGSITVAIAPNTINLSRFTTIQIAGQSFFVYQAASSGCTYSLGSSAQTFGAGGGSGQVSVSAGGTCDWIVRSNASWITVNTPGGQGNGSVNFTVAPNNGSQFRAGTFTVSGRVFTVTQSGRGAKSDFDGDGLTDYAVYRPSQAIWYILQSSNSVLRAQAFGVSDDVVVPADYDGDGKTDIAVWRRSNAVWYILNSSDNSFRAEQWGTSFFDVPVPADYDGDGRADLAVFRYGPEPSTPTYYYIQQSMTRTLRAVQWGDGIVSNAVPADYDGDGKADIAVYSEAGAIWRILQSSNNAVRSEPFGLGNFRDAAVPADYDGDGRADLAVFRRETGIWYLQRSMSGFTAVQFGVSDDLLVTGDYDGDGLADVAVFRSGIWYVLRSQLGFTGVQFGTNGDVPAVRTR